LASTIRASLWPAGADRAHHRQLAPLPLGADHERGRDQQRGLPPAKPITRISPAAWSAWSVGAISTTVASSRAMSTIPTTVRSRCGSPATRVLPDRYLQRLRQAGGERDLGGTTRCPARADQLPAIVDQIAGIKPGLASRRTSDADLSGQR
jgi:hypothetical protein